MQEKKKILLSDAYLKEAAVLFGILSDPSRLKLLRSLMDSSMTVSELVMATGMKQGNVSKHLGVLLASRFVARVQEGNFARYSLADEKLIDLCKLICARIEEDVRKRAADLH